MISNDKEIRTEIIKIIGHNINPELAQIMADQIIKLITEHDRINYGTVQRPGKV